MPDDQLTATLDEIRGRGYRNGARGALCARLSDAAAVDAPRLLAALDAALKLAGDWEAKSKMIGGQIALEDCDGAVAGFKMIGYQNHRDHAAALREVIAAELAKGEATP
jgi:hypothetical protein